MRQWFLVGLLSLLGAVLVLWPVVSAPETVIVCGWAHPDCLSNHWLLVWVAEQVATGGSILHNDRYYWPIGDAPWLAGNGSDGFLYLPWHLLLGWPRASAAHSLTILTLNGVGAYALARAAGASSFAALAAAPTAAMMVYGSHELGAGRFSQANFGFLAFFLASWLRLLSGPNVVRAAISAVLLAVTSFFYWYYGFFGVLAGAILFVGQMIADVLSARKSPAVPLAGAPSAVAPLLLRRRSLGVALSAFSAVFLALVGPLLYVFAAHYAEIPGAAEDSVFPHPEVAGDSTWPGIPFLIGGVRHAGRALPFSTTMLALLALFVRRDRVTVSLAAVALVFAGLMAGPLWPGGPYEQIYGLAAPLRRFWWPYRHVLVLNLSLITLAAVATTDLFERLPGRVRGVGLAVAVAVSIPLQIELSSAPYVALHTQVQLPTDFYTKVREIPGKVILELPLSPKLAASQAPLIYQFEHQKTLLTGHAMWVDRVRPAAWTAFVEQNTFLTAIARLEVGDLSNSFSFSAGDLHAVRQQGLAVITVNHEYLPLKLGPLVGAYEEVLTALFGEPTVSRSAAKAWSTANWTGADSTGFTAFHRPDAVRGSAGTLATGSQRPKSLAFSIEIPLQASPRK